MSIVSMLIAECYLGGESFLYVLYDDATLDILRFEVKGNTKSKLSLMLREDDLKEEVTVTGKIEQGKEIQIVETAKQWKMVKVIEDGEETIKLPPHLRVLANWEAI